MALQRSVKTMILSMSARMPLLRRLVMLIVKFAVTIHILFLHTFAVITVIISRISKSIWRTDYGATFNVTE